jgi:hypothetical protein
VLHHTSVGLSRRGIDRCQNEWLEGRKGERQRLEGSQGRKVERLQRLTALRERRVEGCEGLACVCYVVDVRVMVLPTAQVCCVHA